MDPENDLKEMFNLPETTSPELKFPVTFSNHFQIDLEFLYNNNLVEHISLNVTMQMSSNALIKSHI